MKEVGTLAIKAVNGGLFVVAFALVGEVLTPKRFAGLFSAAPSVALANVLVVVAVKGRHDAAQNLVGMLVGAAGMTGACLAGVWLVHRYRSVRGSAAVCAVWLAVAVPGYFLFLR